MDGWMDGLGGVEWFGALGVVGALIAALLAGLVAWIGRRRGGGRVVEIPPAPPKRESAAPAREDVEALDLEIEEVQDEIERLDAMEDAVRREPHPVDRPDPGVSDWLRRRSEQGGGGAGGKDG